MISAKSLAYVDTVYSADSIECCPFEGYEDLFVCGTYQIVKPEPEPSDSKSTQTQTQIGEEDEAVDEEEEADAGPSRPTERVGRLLLYRVKEDGEEVSLEEVQRIETPAILDTKWCPRLDPRNRPELAVADAKGRVTIYALEDDRLAEKQSIEVGDESTLCLSLDYSHRLHPALPCEIITSLSSGSLAHLIPSQEGYVVSSSWHAHDYEPWIVSWDNWESGVVWSGGDDCKLKRWDVRDTSRPTFVNKNFDAGVTTITSSPHTPHLLAVGSYDEHLRVFDTRAPHRPLETVHLSGGIWRTRFHPSPTRKGDILNATMHDGFKVVRLALSSGQDIQHREQGEQGEDEWQVEVNGSQVISRFDDHTSLAYGADWSRLPPSRRSRLGEQEQEDESLIATCSFYDHALHLWRG